MPGISRPRCVHTAIEQWCFCSWNQSRHGNAAQGLRRERTPCPNAREPHHTRPLRRGVMGLVCCRDAHVLVRLQVCVSSWCVNGHAMLKWAGPGRVVGWISTILCFFLQPHTDFRLPTLSGPHTFLGTQGFREVCNKARAYLGCQMGNPCPIPKLLCSCLGLNINHSCRGTPHRETCSSELL